MVRPGRWRPSASLDHYSLFARTAAPHPLYAVPHAGGPSPHISVVSDAANAETFRVRTASPAVVVRDVAWDAGWRASVSVNGGPPEPLRVAPHGLTEQVLLPAGADVVTFTYRPPHWEVASILTGGATLLLIVLGVVVLCRRRRRVRRRGGRRSDESLDPPAPTAAPEEPACAFGAVGAPGVDGRAARDPVRGQQ